jgi:mono/diheme cytochrome c family protein
MAMFFGLISTSRKIAAEWLVMLAVIIVPITASAQSAVNGKSLYNAVLVTGEKSCGNGACHGPDPSVNQNRIKNGTSAAVIASTISTNLDMRFLQGVLSTSQLNDLAAYIANPSATNTAPIATLSSTILGFGQVTVGTTSATQNVTLRNTGASALQLSALTVGGSEFSVSTVAGSCSATTTLAVSASCTIAITFTPAAASVRSATLSIAHNAVGSPSTVSLAGTGVASTGGVTTTMIEYFFAALDYYFITSRAGDIALLDTAAGWTRTGKSFKVYTTQQSGTVAVNRYYFDQIAVANSRGSHFYTVVQAEKDALASLNPSNAQTPRLPFNEGQDSFAFSAVVEGVGGSCAAGQLPVYRIFRGQTRFPDNPNHRFTTDTAIYNSFVASGWDGEGVKFCVPN